MSLAEGEGLVLRRSNRGAKSGFRHVKFIPHKRKRNASNSCYYETNLPEGTFLAEINKKVPKARKLLGNFVTAEEAALHVARYLALN